jgi:hypothetical protein
MKRALFFTCTIFVIDVYRLAVDKEKSTKTTLEVYSGMIESGDEFEKVCFEADSKVASLRALNPDMTIVWTMKVD